MFTYDENKMRERESVGTYILSFCGYDKSDEAFFFTFRMAFS